MVRTLPTPQRLEYGAIARDHVTDPVLFSFESDVGKQGEARPPASSEQCVIRGISDDGVSLLGSGHCIYPV